MLDSGVSIISYWIGGIECSVSDFGALVAAYQIWGQQKWHIRFGGIDSGVLDSWASVTAYQIFGIESGVSDLEALVAAYRIQGY